MVLFLDSCRSLEPPRFPFRIHAAVSIAHGPFSQSCRTLGYPRSLFAFLPQSRLHTIPFRASAHLFLKLLLHAPKHARKCFLEYIHSLTTHYNCCAPFQIFRNAPRSLPFIHENPNRLVSYVTVEGPPSQVQSSEALAFLLPFQSAATGATKPNPAVEGYYSSYNSRV